MTSRKCVVFVLSMICTACALGGACDANVLPPPEAVLAGAWQVSAEDSIQNNKVFVFDESGRLSEIRSTIGSTTLVERNVHDTTRVVGNEVFIKTKAGLIFEGTLSVGADAISGALRTEVNILFTNNTLITDLGSATFTRQ